MPEIKLLTEINAPIAICFDLSRSIDLHKISTSETSEEATSGVTTGLIGLNEYVTWEAVHFGVKQKLTSKITAYERPFHFADEQIKGAFKYFRHTHNFSEIDGKVTMVDLFNFSSPYGLFGKIFDKIVLTKYLQKLLINRNEIIKLYAETEHWKCVLNEKNYK